jgi:hypothetical protein
MEPEPPPERDRLKSELVATVSHEMRRPLTAVLGFAQTLRRRWDELTPELRDELLSRVERNAEALEHMIGQVLDYSRLELGQFPPELRPIELGPLVARVVENLAHELAGHDVGVRGTDALRVKTEPYASSGSSAISCRTQRSTSHRPAGSRSRPQGTGSGSRSRYATRDLGSEGGVRVDDPTEGAGAVFTARLPAAG